MSSFDPRKNRQPEGNNGLLLAALAAVLFMMGWDYFAPQQNNVAQPVAEQSTINGMPGAPAAIAGQAMASAQSSDADAASPSVQRIALESASLSGGVALVGGRIDELDLKNYTVTLEGFPQKRLAALVCLRMSSRVGILNYTRFQGRGMIGTATHRHW